MEVIGPALCGILAAIWLSINFVGNDIRRVAAALEKRNEKETQK